MFLKLNQINVCITEDEEKDNQPMYIACNVKYLRIDEFSSMRFDAIKPKLFENERPGMENSFSTQFSSFVLLDELNNDDVPPIAIRIDFPKGQTPSPPPLVTLQMQNRSLTTTSHALDVLSQNLEEILTDEEKLERQNQPLKSPPIDINLNNVQITLKVTILFTSTPLPIGFFSFPKNIYQNKVWLKLNLR